jgi:hypothetical protein
VRPEPAELPPYEFGWFLRAWLSRAMKAHRVLTMVIDKEAAGLLAQVIPTLLIFLALEGRLKKPAGEPFWFRVAHVFLRLFALLFGLFTTYLCLFIVMIGPEAMTFLGKAGDIIVLVTVGLVFFEALVVIAKSLWKETDEHL